MDEVNNSLGWHTGTAFGHTKILHQSSLSANHSLANRHSCPIPAKKWRHRYRQCWTNCGRYDQSADDICLSKAWSA